MLILEGSDNLGKTTVAQEIVIQAKALMDHHFQYRHMSRPKEDFDFFLDYKKMIKATPLTTVQDRFHLGGLIWHEDKISRASLKVIEGWVHANFGLVVIFYTEDHTGYRKMLESDTRNQMFGVDKMCQANIEYAAMARGDYPFPVSCDLAIPTEIYKNKPHHDIEVLASKVVGLWKESLSLCMNIQTNYMGQ